MRSAVLVGWVTLGAVAVVVTSSSGRAQPADDQRKETGSGQPAGDQRKEAGSEQPADDQRKETGSDDMGHDAKPTADHKATATDHEVTSLHLGADRTIVLHIDHERTRTDRVPTLSLDPNLTSRFEGLAKTDSREWTSIAYGNTTLTVEGIASSNVDRADQPAIDLDYRGWHAGAQLSQRVGPLELTAGGALHHDETRYASGTYYDLGVALTYRFKLAESMRAWISLGLGRRTWVGDAPVEGEPKESTSLMLRFGFTF